jgi:hypothetical protein
MRWVRTLPSRGDYLLKSMIGLCFTVLIGDGKFSFVKKRESFAFGSTIAGLYDIPSKETKPVLRG